MTELESRPITVMVVDDHQTMLWGLQQLINARAPRMSLVATATGAEEAVLQATACQPDLILLDMDLGPCSGLELIPQLLACCSGKILILTGMRDQKPLDQAILAGARGIIRKEDSAESIIQAIEKVHAGQIWVDRDAMGRIFQRMQEKDVAEKESPQLESLTRREREIVKALVEAADAPNKVLAQKLFMGEHTLRNHLSIIYEKLGVASRIQLYLYAVEKGLGPEQPAKAKPRSQSF